MTTMQRTTTWGRDLRDKVQQDFPPGMKGVEAIAHDAVSPAIGSRTTFSALYKLDGPPSDPTMLFRAWITLVVIGQDPNEWGINDTAVPHGFVVEHLRQRLRMHSRWYLDEAAHLLQCPAA